ncbi:MAG: class III signal peptide-containing protein [Candidatus Diapherotrites archaeon]
MKLLEEQKAQGSLEYLLLLGGIVAVVAIIGLYLKSYPKTLEGSVNAQTSATEGQVGK